MHCASHCSLQHVECAPRIVTKRRGELTCSSRTCAYSGASDWVTMVGPDENVALLNSCAECNNAPPKANGWLKAKTCNSGAYTKVQWHCPHCGSKWKWGTSAADRWIIIYQGKDDLKLHPSTSIGRTTRKIGVCENTFQWLRKLKLSQEKEKVRSQINLVNVIKCLDEMNNRVANRLEKTQNMEIFTTQCKDPATFAYYPSCGLICPKALWSVQYVGRPVRMGKKPNHSRAMIQKSLSSFVQCCYPWWIQVSIVITKLIVHIVERIKMPGITLHRVTC
eukprot:5793439-Amphidinium_carterae.2